MKNREPINDGKLSRRAFIRNTSLAAAGTITGALAGKGYTSGEDTRPADISKILNHNPKMKYRRLGRTGLMVSEVSLGGHWANLGGVSFWGKFANDEVPDSVAKNRTEVVCRCIEHGINYLDITTGAECLAYGAALKGRRQKMYIAADDSDLCPRIPDFCNVKAQLHNIDECLRRLGTDYLDVWRPQFRQDGEHPDSDIEACVGAFEKAHAQGKVRWLGMSSHSREFIRHIIEKFPQYSVVTFPYTAKSKVKPADVKSVDPRQVVRSGGGLYSKDGRESIFELVQKHDIGVVTIKPFGAGALFRTPSSSGTNAKTETESTEENHQLARLTLAYILCNGRISAVIPGMDSVAEVDNNVRASIERLSLLDQNGIWKLCEANEQMWANLPEGYRWLCDWEWV